MKHIFAGLMSGAIGAVWHICFLAIGAPAISSAAFTIIIFGYTYFTFLKIYQTILDKDSLLSQIRQLLDEVRNAK